MSALAVDIYSYFPILSVSSAHRLYSHRCKNAPLSSVLALAIDVLVLAVPYCQLRPSTCSLLKEISSPSCQLLVVTALAVLIQQSTATTMCHIYSVGYLKVNNVNVDGTHRPRLTARPHEHRQNRPGQWSLRHFFCAVAI